ncbi:multiple sugar transport system permease protein [Kaistia hirudinis]|uniref:Multiple sugar transport system permease protein n=1 Tax=Kaistia hirudinis TaxID=1293440 RepID=A0A840AXI0_9HYPH|nr:sugar ABC transporter permease [Kaistia hirudinis]MBB3933858.1 multiple sugar transport system permease protein [Kaistia hirudinis]MBN9019972.1 sugar ABC transporter permease [Hyphomicrobiales bacterium]
MLKSRKSEVLAAIVLAGPFVALYAWMFIYPTIQMVHLSFQNAPLIGEGTWAGLKNYTKLLSDRTFKTAVWNTAYFVLLTVVPGTAVALAIALMVSRLNGWFQSIILAMFFVPYVLPVTVVYILWDWMVNVQFGVLQPVIALFTGKPVNVWRTIPWFMPGVAIVTIWWTNGFSILLFLAGIRNIPKEIYEAALLDGASRTQVFWRVTWPLLWPVTVLCLTIQLILQLKIFDQVYLFSMGGRTQVTMVMVQYIFEQGFQRNNGGYAATIAVALFVIVVAVSVLQLQAARLRRGT